MPDIAAALSKSPLFTGLPVDPALFRTREFAKNQLLPAELDGEAALALIVAGRVQVYSGTGADAVQLSTLGPGECLGVSTIFSGRELTTVPRCDQRTTAAFLTRGSFLGLLQAHPELFLRYATLCNEKISYLTARIAFLTMPSCRSRLVRYLLQNEDDAHIVRLPTSKERFAKALGTSRASLFRELALLTEQGLVLVEGRCIHILREDLLDAILLDT